MSWTAIVAAVLSVVLAGCSATSGAGDGKTRIKIATFGEFGYEPLFAEYEAQHPGIDLVPEVSDFESHHKGLATQLAGGSGAADIVAIEEQYMPQFIQSRDKFVNLADLGAKDMQGQWVPWKWERGVSKDGGFVLGLGTDMGGLALCYRRDLFEKAGLPTQREEVAKLWPTWEDFTRVGDRFSAAVPDVKFADSAGSIYTAILNQAEENFFSKADESFIADRNPNLRRAFDIAGTMGAKGQTANVTTYTQAWNVAVKQGSFAVMNCPAWMLDQIRSAGGDENKGKWDVTTVPGNSGNQGGSYLTLPKQGAHHKEAYEVAKWLTAPEQQKRIFLQSGILPSAPAAYQAPEVISKTDQYFNDAPVGQIYAASADSLRPNYRGAKDSVVRPLFGQALGRVEDGKQGVEAAWAEAVQQARGAIG
ncbi:putative sugar binding secreted protein [Saccharopolyspora erythraea NRRL 2338]|uniref:Sugar binding secreted protein n=1 Tax=Saccharopolyspora erythraea (strain ATCC 11635 / DSM 40517 / JCM 4748 / NBRC 13426 / NCIMB 8594 / NRRL 2338) TaxID=405948 RepID=A4FKW4_SACEN|nr:sugar ABC transporter substrate-binding protein [Saccharopolyspora erythraea D]CAM04689.1 putative sugar binding secreted protein [Saccharopolyspora erythraea NRRL 2338]